MLGSKLNQGARSIWIRSTSKKEQSEENHHGKEKGMEDEEDISDTESGFYVVFFLATDGFVWNMAAVLLCWKNYVQFKCLDFQSKGFVGNK